MTGMWAAIPFFASLALLGAFMWYRTKEEASGKLAFAKERAELDAKVEKIYRAAVMGDIPSHFRIFLLKLGHQIAHAVVVLTVKALRAAERPLTRFSYHLRRNAPVASGKGPSEFLKTISPVKKEDGTTTEG
jgi:hypothetical protein